jgi:hypothetical protein
VAERPAEGEPWPADVQPLSIEDLARLGINAKNELFWDGKVVEVRRALVLSRFQTVFAWIVSVFAILGGLGGLFSGIQNASLFLCARDVAWLTCPAPRTSLAVPAPVAVPATAPAPSAPIPPAATGP